MMTSKSPDNQAETILKVGIEGGTITLIGRRLGLRQWAYSVQSDSMGFEDMPGQSHDYGPVNAWDEALALLAQVSEHWLSFYPVQIHPEFRDRIRAIVEQNAADLRGNALQRWKALLEEPAVKKPSKQLFKYEEMDFSKIQTALVGDWKSCTVKYQIWSYSESSGRSLELWGNNGTAPRLLHTIWKASEHPKQNEKPADAERLTQVVDYLKSLQWEIVANDEGKSDMPGWGGESWKSVTLQRLKKPLEA